MEDHVPQVLGALMLLSSYCVHDARLTAYVRSEYGPYTYDGTPILSDEPLAAASWDIPLQSTVCIPDLGCYRVADRGGGLGSYRWIDVAVWSRAEAYAITAYPRFACIYPPGGG